MKQLSAEHSMRLPSARGKTLIFFEGLLIALDHLDEVIALIRSLTTSAIAQDGLITQFQLSEIQAKAIL